MSKNESLNHANHNKEVCEYLNKDTKYGDWIITTAFYSALHFIDHKVFPLELPITKGSKVNFVSFESYYNFCKKNKDISKHKARTELVEKLLPQISHHYNKLGDLCHHARYVDYKYDYEIAKDAKESCLVEIEKNCIE